MNAHLSRFLSALTILFLSSTMSVFSLPPDEYLEDTPDFENMLSDLPPGFDFSAIGESELRSVPFHGPKNNEPPVSFRGGFITHRGESPETGRQYMKIYAGSGDTFRLSALGERDPFEPRAVDLASIGIAFPVERLNTLVTLGDFRPGFGMGLLFSRYTAYLTGDLPRRSSSANTLNTSFEETRFMRGGMVITRTGSFELSIWTSVRHLDAVMEEGNAVSLDDTGLHLSGVPRGNLEERITGAHFSLGTKQSEVSVTGALSHYSPGFSRPEGERFFGRPEASSFAHFSVYGRTSRGPATLSFEHARMRGGEYATMGGITIDSGKAETSLLVRDYSPGFWAPRSGAPSAFGTASNERGIYTSLNVSLPRRVNMAASLDIAKMNGRSWSRPMPESRTPVFSFTPKADSITYGRKHGVPFRR